MTSNVYNIFYLYRQFNGQEDQHSVELCSTDVTIVPSPGDHDHGSSKVKLKNIVDFQWDHHLYTGQLLAVHVSGKYLAYGIKGKIYLVLYYINFIIIYILYILL